MCKRLKLPRDCVVFVDPQPRYYILTVPHKQNEKGEENQVNDQSHKKAIVDPHEQEGRDVEEQKLEHKVFEARERLVFQLVYRKVNCVHVLSS